MITYTLTWDEFLEFNQHFYPDAMPRRSNSSVIVCLVAALMTLAFGVYLINVLPFENRIVASLTFLVLTLLVVLLAFWDRARAVETGKRKDRALHLAYEHEYADPRLFSFDQVQWTLQSQAGKRETLWTGLTAAHWLQNIVILAAADHFTVITRRALSPEQEELMRKFAHGGQGQRMSFELPFLDYALIEIPASWRRNPMTPLYCLAGIALVFLVLSTEPDSRPSSFLRWLLGVLCLGIAIFALQSFYYLFKYKRGRDKTAVAWQAEFSELGASARTAKTDSFLAWSNFEKFKESRRCFLLYMRSPAERYYFLAKTCVSLEQQTALRQLLQAKLGGGATS